MTTEIKYCGNCKHGRRKRPLALYDCAKEIPVEDWVVDTKNNTYVCGEWEEKVFTHADAIRQMTDEELVAEIGRLQDIAAACPSCHQKTGVERLRLYLSTRADR